MPRARTSDRLNNHAMPKDKVGPVAALCHWQGKTKVQQMNRELSIEVFLMHLRTALYASKRVYLRDALPERHLFRRWCEMEQKR